MEKNIVRLAKKIQSAYPYESLERCKEIATNWSNQILSCDLDDLLTAKADDDFFLTALEAFLYA